MTTHYEKFQAVRLHSGVSHTDGAVCTGAGSPPPSFVPSVHDPAIAQPVILSPADSLPSSLTRTAIGSPTSLYLNIGAEDDYHFPEKRKRDEADDFNASKFAHIDSPSSSTSSSHDEYTSDDLSSVSRKPGRKPMPDDDDLSQDAEHDPKVKRKAQNRAAQRAFRERKERYVKELEAKIKQLQDNHFHASSQLVQENQHLRSVVYRLEAENFALKGIHIQFPIHPSPYIMYTPPTSNGAAPVNAAASPQASTHPHHHPHHPPLLAPAMPTTASPPPPMHQQQQHQQQYTFSISTPATLRPKKPASETASTTATSTNSSSPSSSSSQEQFCQILHNQVSNNVIEQLLSEPLFDTSGGLVIQHHAHQQDTGAAAAAGAAPTTTTTTTTTTTSTSIPTSNHTTGLLTTAEVWQRLTQHDHFSLFTVEELCNQVARHIKSTHQGLALEERDLEAVFREMDLAKKP
ncbi:hypothetical protein O0I10_002733 [Lichtheimia ornata]|uniref:BZIP domain-containing protein n=1 Tax=Lichtheimia ornata TaxID=688661 RepID=A0AAD7V9F6_9FUNG|nr:uncharacterized protein O0I10_002733 [Lichtheimia ornata]KAJ8661467.1 hypothetical protein O0I10_002733 [Lichtheimia ornata]